MPRIVPHSGFVDLKNSFDEVWQRLSEIGAVPLKTTTKGRAFVARATTATRKGSNENEKTVIFLQQSRDKKAKESARCYECCWGFYCNCYRTRIGMYCEALDSSI